MSDPSNPTAIALDLLTAIEGMAKQWEADGKHDDANLIRTRGPQFAASLSRLIATDPDTMVPMLQEHLAVTLADLRQQPSAGLSAEPGRAADA
ncbi:hypothetical protein ACFUEM_38755 [Streptomyces anulatus]|uniref:hypothetical protein n=1 Tax=Streptomyces anulatus TaxID=1892 RepID=UPI0035D8EB9F